MGARMSRAKTAVEPGVPLKYPEKGGSQYGSLGSDRKVRLTYAGVVYIMSEVWRANRNRAEFTTRGGNIYGRELEASTLARILNSRTVQQTVSNKCEQQTMA
jgi:hypothetical protein